MNELLQLWYAWLQLLLGFIVGTVWPKGSRRIINIVLLGVPSMLVGYLFGYIQAGFMTGYHLYKRDSE